MTERIELARERSYPTKTKISVFVGVATALLVLGVYICIELATPQAPPLPEVDHRGELGWTCKPDGSCISPMLECVEPELYLGLPIDPGGARCRAKGSK